MKFFLPLLIVVSMVSAGFLDSKDIEQATDKLIDLESHLETLEQDKKETFAKIFEEIFVIKKIRSMRSLQRTCGAQISVRVARVCGGNTKPGSDKDLSSQCCYQKCTDDYFKTAVCPSA